MAKSLVGIAMNTKQSIEQTAAPVNTAAQLPEKTMAERVLHAVMFEVGGILLATPLAAWVMGSSLSHVGVLTVILATTAMIWNMVFNHGFEIVERRRGWQRTPLIRTMHALMFEGGFMLLALPLTMWWMQLSLWQALMLDVGFFLFFLPYTYLYNWLYDTLRKVYFRRAQVA
jgi:uncharacterized membrane protein